MNLKFLGLGQHRGKVVLQAFLETKGALATKQINNALGGLECLKMETQSEALPGHLYVVSTPIGNLQDLSVRAKDILLTCDSIACEDTRVTGKLLKKIGSNRPSVSYREENEIAQSEALVEQLKQGASIALVCDAGTPTISDPGFRVVRACRRENLPVVPIPGPVAFATALSCSGFPTNGFLYAGFLPPKSSARKRFMEKYLDFEYSIVVYESCHRILKFVQDAKMHLGPERWICVARELTKLHETFLIGQVQDVLPKLKGSNLKGEFVVVIAPQSYQL